MRILLGLGAVSFALALMPAAALAQTSFVASIDNAQEQAAGNCLGGSTAEGSATMTLNPDDTLSYDITFGNNAPDFDNGLLDQGAENNAHFHIAPPGMNGGVAFGLPAGSPKSGATAALSAGQLADLQAGNFYINIHSTGCGAGEIRGQVVAAPPVPLLSPVALVGLAMGLGAVGTLAARRLRTRA